MNRELYDSVILNNIVSFQNGVFYGTGNILGYDKVGKDMIINEEQAKTVKLIYEMFLKGEESTNIKYELEKRGCVTPTALNKQDFILIGNGNKVKIECNNGIFTGSNVGLIKYHFELGAGNENFEWE